jgi:hypothetical protein
MLKTTMPEVAVWKVGWILEGKNGSQPQAYRTYFLILDWVLLTKIA